MFSKSFAETALAAIQAAWDEADRVYKLQTIEVWADAAPMRQSDPAPPVVPDDTDALTNEEVATLYSDLYSWKVEYGGDLSSEDYETIDTNDGFDQGVEFAMGAIRKAFEIEEPKQEGGA